MADFTEIADELVGLLAGIAYPDGIGAPSVIGLPIALYQGWPNPPDLDQDMTGDSLRVHVSVWPTNIERVINSFAARLMPLEVVEPTITVTVAGNQITVGGTATAGQNIGLVIDGAAFGYTVQQNDSTTSIATALANAISAAQPATNAGPVIAVPGARLISQKTGGTATMVAPLERIEKVFQITIWAPSPAARDGLAKVLDPALRGTTRIVLADGTGAVLRYRNSVQTDALVKQGAFRRDMNYAVEYVTTQTATATEVVTAQLNVTIKQTNEPLATSGAIGNKTIYS